MNCHIIIKIFICTGNVYILIIKQKNDGKALFKCTNMWFYSPIASNYHFMLNLAMKYKKKLKTKK